MFTKKILSLMVLAAFAGAATAEEAVAPPSAPSMSLTRAEVIADTQIWRQSGLAAVDMQSSDGFPLINSDRHEKARAEYQRLRASPQYTALVRKIADDRGESASTRAQGPSMAASKASGLTRAEVLADTEIWRRSGLGAMQSRADELGVMAYGGRYKEAKAEYDRLRSSPEFAALVQRIAADRGESMTSAAAGKR